MLKTLMVTAALVGAASSANAVNLLVNASFETVGGPYGAKAFGNSDISDWTIQGGTIFLAGPADWLADNATNSVLLSGGTAGAIGQLVDVVVGETYALSFSYAANPNIGTPGKPAYGIASFAEANQLIDFTRIVGQSPINVGWIDVTYMFVAPRTGPVLVSFNAVADDPRFAVAIDAISLEMVVVPEPATWAMLIAGFGLVGFSVRRRRAAMATVSG